MRDLFIRIRIILISLVFIVLLTGFLVFPSAVIETATRLEEQERGIRILLALAALLADVILLFIIFQELRFRRRTESGLIVRSRAISAEVSLESVQSHLDNQVSRLEHVHTTKTRVRAERGRVVIEMDLDADDRIDVRKMTQKIHREIVKVVEKQMGLKLGAKPVIRFRLLSEPAQISLDEPAPDQKKGGLAGLFGREKTAEDDIDTEVPPKSMVESDVEDNTDPLNS